MKKPKKPRVEDEAQSRRFMEEAAKAAADGGLSPTEAEGAFERAIGELKRNRNSASSDSLGFVLPHQGPKQL